LIRLKGGALEQGIRFSDRGLFANFSKGASVLDVGCGDGAFVRFARDLGYDAYGLEPDEVAARTAERAGAPVLGATIWDLGSDRLQSFDQITMSHVIEHVHEPLRELERCFKLLKPGGRLWLVTPNASSAGLAHFGRHWRGLEVPRHLVLFSPQSLVAAVHRAGFNQVNSCGVSDPVPDMVVASHVARLGRLSGGAPRARDLPFRARVRALRDIAILRSKTRSSPTCSEFLAITAVRSA